MAKTRSAESISLNKSEQKKVAKQTKTLKKKIEDGTVSVKETRKDLKLKAEQKRGLIYIAHIPHGFYENEMKSYFKQFGVVTNVKVCRSKRTGNSKGFGYVEFAHPDVAKIAAETMNNYLMFKKKIVAQFVPYAKRPKGLFHGKSSTVTKYSTKTRRSKQILLKNQEKPASSIIKKSKCGINKLTRKLQKLQNVGISCDIEPLPLLQNVGKSCDIEPLDLTEIKQETGSNTSVDYTYVADSADSDVEFKIPLRKSKKSVDSSRKSSIKSLTTSSNKALLTKSLDSVKAILSNNDSTEKKESETQTLPVKNVKTERNKKSRGIKKKEKTTLPLNCETVKKIARELIRKKGNPLLNLITTKGKKKSLKKK